LQLPNFVDLCTYDRSRSRQDTQQRPTLPRRAPHLPDTPQIVQRCGAEAVAAAGRPGLVVVYEDDDMACVVKPQGLPTQGKGDGSLQGRIKWVRGGARVGAPARFTCCHEHACVHLLPVRAGESSFGVACMAREPFEIETKGGGAGRRNDG
jgi:hypothetical protein